MFFSAQKKFIENLGLTSCQVNAKSKIISGKANEVNFVFAFLRLKKRTKLIIYSKSIWSLFSREISLGKRKRSSKKIKRVTTISFETLEKFDEMHDHADHCVKILVISDQVKIHIVSESDIEILKTEDTVNGIHIINKKRVESFIQKYSKKELEKKSIKYIAY